MNSIDANLNWGERDSLYPKRLDYMFSLTVAYRMGLPLSAGVSAALRADCGSTENQWDTFHVLDKPFLRTANGIQHEVPRARLVFGSDSMLIRDEGAVTLDGNMVLETDTPDHLSMRYKGVLNVSRGTQRFCAPPKLNEPRVGPSGSLSIASTQDVTNPKYRWMVQSQLIGVGRMSSVFIIDPEGAAWLLTFDYDFHIAS